MSPVPVDFAGRERFVLAHHLTSLNGDGDQVYVTSETGSVWEPRCVLGSRDPAGKVLTEVLKRDCNGVRGSDLLSGMGT